MNLSSLEERKPAPKSGTTNRQSFRELTMPERLALQRFYVQCEKRWLARRAQEANSGK